MVSSSTSELLKGLRSSSVSSQRSSEYSTRSSSPLSNHRILDGIQSKKEYSLSEYQPSRRKIDFQHSNWDQKSDRISSSRMKAGLQINDWESSGTSYRSSTISSASYNGNDLSSSCNEKGLLSSMPSTRNATDVLLARREGMSILSSSASIRSRSSTRSSRSTEDDLEDLDRKIKKIHKALARLENETSDLSKETHHLKEVNLNIKRQLDGSVDSSKRFSKQQLAKSVDILKTQLKDENKHVSLVSDSYHQSVSTEKRLSYQDDIPELSLSLSDDSTDSLDDFEFEVMSQARCDSIRSKSKHSSGSSTRSCSSSPAYPGAESNGYGSSSSTTRSSSASRTSRPPLPFSSSRRATSPLVVLRDQ